MNVGNCNDCIHCEEVMGDDAKCELNDVQIAMPIPDECIHFDKDGEQR